MALLNLLCASGGITTGVGTAGVVGSFAAGAFFAEALPGFDEADEDAEALDVLNDETLDEDEDIEVELLTLELLLDTCRGLTGSSSSGGADLHAANMTAPSMINPNQNLL